jgi:hypothetical protein
MFSHNAGNFRDPKNFPEYAPGPPTNLAPSALVWWFRHWLAPPPQKKHLAESTTGISYFRLKLYTPPYTLYNNNNNELIEIILQFMNSLI